MLHVTPNDTLVFCVGQAAMINVHLVNLRSVTCVHLYVPTSDIVPLITLARSSPCAIHHLDKARP